MSSAENASHQDDLLWLREPQDILPAANVLTRLSSAIFGEGIEIVSDKTAIKILAR